MEDLHAILKSLSPNQNEALQRLLTCFSSRKQTETKTQLLANLILADGDKILSSEYYSVKIFGVYNPKAFSKLKIRLYDRIYDCLLMSFNLDKAEKIDPTDDALIRIKKKSALYTCIRFEKQLQSLASKLLDEIIEESKQIEYFPGLVEHLRYKKWQQARTNGTDSYEFWDKEQKHYENISSALNKAADYYNMLVAKNKSTANSDKKAIAPFLEKSIAVLNAYPQESKSKSFEYYQLWLQFELYSMRKDYLFVKNTCHSLIELINANKSIFREQRISFVYDNLAETEIYLSNYDSAIQYSAQAQKHFSKKSRNLSLSQNLQFLANFHKGDFAEAEKTNTSLLSFLKDEVGEFDFSKYNFYKANLFFINGNFKEADAHLSLDYKILDDTTGYGIGVRVLHILTHIESADDDRARRGINSLDQFIYRLSPTTEQPSVRDIQILNFLQSLDKEGFQFNMLNKKAHQQIELLSNPSGEYPWQPFTAELIPFHQWVNSKIKRKVSK